MNHSVEAVNATSAATTAVDMGTIVVLFFTVVIPELFKRLFVFVAAPFLYPEMWWLLIHLALTFFLFEFYFERHHGENLGWTAALANSVVMIFISLELLRSIYGHYDSPFAVFWNVVQDYFALGLFHDQMVMVSLIFILFGAGIFTAVINYFHLLPGRLAFIVSGHKTVNLLAYFLIVVVWRYTQGVPIPLDGITFVAIFLYGLMMWSLFFMINMKFMSKRARKTHKVLFK